MTIDEMRRIYAGAVYELLRVAPVGELHYDGDYRVTAGHLRAHFGRRAVEISFPDPYGDPADDAPVVLSISCPYTFGAMAMIIEGLAGQLAVKP